MEPAPRKKAKGRAKGKGKPRPRWNNIENIPVPVSANIAPNHQAVTGFIRSTMTGGPAAPMPQAVPRNMSIVQSVHAHQDRLRQAMKRTSPMAFVNVPQLKH